jgi:hypothetical protein
MDYDARAMPDSEAAGIVKFNAGETGTVLGQDGGGWLVLGQDDRASPYLA